MDAIEHCDSKPEHDVKAATIHPCKPIQPIWHWWSWVDLMTPGMLPTNSLLQLLMVGVYGLCLTTTYCLEPLHWHLTRWLVLTCLWQICGGSNLAQKAYRLGRSDRNKGFRPVTPIRAAGRQSFWFVLVMTMLWFFLHVQGRGGKREGNW